MAKLFKRPGGVSFALSGERLPGRGSSGSLSAPTLQSDIAQSIGVAPRINPKAGDTRFSPMPIPRYEHDITFESASRLAGVWANAAFNFKEREDAIIANDLVSQYETRARELVHGGVDVDGKALPGYYSTEGTASKDAYGVVVGELEKERDRLLQNADPNVRTKALLRMQNTYNHSVAKIATHRAKQMKVAEQQALAREGINVQKLFEEGDYDYAWQMAKEHALKFNDPIQQEKVLSELMTLAVAKIGDETRTAGGTPADAYAAMDKFFQKYREDVSESTETAVSSKLTQQKDMLKREQERLRKEAVAKARQQALAQGGSRMLGYLVSGEEGIKAVSQYAKDLINLYGGNVDKANDALLTNYKEAFSAIATSSPAGIENARAVWEDMKERVRKGEYYGDVITLSKLQQFMSNDIPDIYKDERDRIEDQNTRRWNQELNNAQDELRLEELRQGYQSNPTFTANEEQQLENLYKTRKKEIRKEVTEAETQERDDQFLQEMGQVGTGGLTTDARTRLRMKRANGLLSSEQYNVLLKEYRDQESKGEVPTRGNLKRRLWKAIDKGQEIYDPVRREVVFPHAMDEDELEDLQKNLSFHNKPPEVRKQITLQYRMEEADQWIKENPGKDYDDWYTSAYMASSAKKNSMWIDILTNLLVPQSFMPRLEAGVHETRMRHDPEYRVQEGFPSYQPPSEVPGFPRREPY